MVTDQDKVVSVAYELRLKNFDSEVIEAARPDSPLEFLYGHGNMLEKFEENLKNKKEGDSFEFKLTTEQAYGQIDENAIIDLPKEHLPDDPNLIKLGNLLPLQDQGGNRFVGKILDIKDTHVRIDMNHPLAGEDLFFKGKILNIREATQEELEQKHIHNGGCDCGCDCSSDDDFDNKQCNDGGGCGCH